MFPAPPAPLRTLADKPVTAQLPAVRNDLGDQSHLDYWNEEGLFWDP